MLANAIDFLDDGLNPVVVKETRQALNSKLVFSIMSLMLLLQLVAMLVIITSSGGGEALGGACFYTMLAAFCFGAFLGVGLKTGLKVAKERGQDSAGLVFASAIGPYKIIRGKLFSAFILTLLLMSMSAPFMTVSYFLGGIELPQILAFCFLALAAFIPFQQLVILIGVLNTGAHIKRAAWGGLVFGLFIIIINLSAAARFSHFDICSWKFLGGAVLLSAVVTAALHIAAAAVISPPHSNRAAPLRIYIFAIWLAGFFASLASSVFTGAYEWFEVWFVASFLAMDIFLVAALAERDTQTRRVMRKLPRGKASRWIFFIFSSGSVSGELFALGIIFITALICAWNYFQFSPKLSVRGSEYMLGWSLYLGSYALEALAAKRAVRKFAPSKAAHSAFIVFVFILISVTLGPMILDAVTCGGAKLFSDRAWHFYILSPVSLAKDERFMDGITTALFMLFLAFLLAMPEIIAQLREYFPRPCAAEERKNTDAV